MTVEQAALRYRIDAEELMDDLIDTLGKLL